jgi:hypothetical protein
MSSLCSYDEVEKFRQNNPNAKVINYADEEPDKVNIPDIQVLNHEIIKILEFMNQDEILALKDGKDNKLYADAIEKKFPTFAMNFYSILKLLISGSDISTLITMLKTLHGVKKNKLNFEDEERKLGEKLANDFVYPNIDKQKKKK